MSVINKGKSFANGEQLTADKLNQVIDNATFSASAVDNVSTLLVGGAIAVKDDGISTAKIDDGAVTKIKLATDALEAAYPVGSIYMNASNATNPGTLLGFGTWVAFGAGRVPVGIDSGDTDFDAAEETGGVKEVTLSAEQSGLPLHGHKYQLSASSTPTSGSSGGFMTQSGGFNAGPHTGNPSNTSGDQIGGAGGTDANDAHTNLQPYIVVHMWKRTV